MAPLLADADGDGLALEVRVLTSECVKAALTEGDTVPEVDAVGLADASAQREGDVDVVFEGRDDTVLSEEGDPLDESRAVPVASALRVARELEEGVLHIELDDDAVVVAHAEGVLIALSVTAPEAIEV